MKIKKETAFEVYRQTLSENDLEKLNAFFLEYDGRNTLPRSDRVKMRADFENAILYYTSAGVTLEEALSRLDLENLGGFYARPPVLWYALDDAAKIYPISMKHGQMAVFRLSVYFKDEIVPAILQMALTFVIKRFPSFSTSVKKGFFWHYLDTAKHRYFVLPETDIPCRPLKISKSGSPSFRVLYYQNRVSVEFFHILTDATGGMVFLKTLTAEYLRLLGAPACKGDGVLDLTDMPSAEEAINAFSRVERTANASGFVDSPALQLGGKLSRHKPCRVLHFKMDALQLKEAAKKRNVTVTVYILSRMFVASRYAIDELNGTVSIQVPVNMRKFYPSDTLRNFAMYCGIKLPIERIHDADALLPDITAQLAEKAAKPAMDEMANAAERMVGAIRYVPLFVKSSVASIIYGYLGDKIITNTLSNLGVVTLPPELDGYIESMDFVLGTAITNRVSCSMVTYGNTATLSIAKMTVDPSYEEKLLHLLCEDDIQTRVEGSDLYED